MAGTNLHISLNSGNGLRMNLTGGMAERIRMASPASGIFSGKITIHTVEEWGQTPTYIPVNGEIAIYSDRHVVNGINYPGMKIGDGKAYVVDLPFMGDDETNRIIDIINNHVNDASIHVSEEDRNFWNNKLNCEIDGENLVLTRN